MNMDRDGWEPSCWERWVGDSCCLRVERVMRRGGVKPTPSYRWCIYVVMAHGEVVELASGGGDTALGESPEACRAAAEQHARRELGAVLK